MSATQQEMELHQKEHSRSPGRRLYPPAGWTQTPEMAALLAPYESHRSRGVVILTFMPQEVIEQITRDCPFPSHRERRTATSPTMQELRALGAQYPGMLFNGFRVVPERLDERIVLDAVYLPRFGISLNAEKVGLLVHRLKPDDFEATTHETRKYFRFGWG
jgi:hypothetical protein